MLSRPAPGARFLGRATALAVLAASILTTGPAASAATPPAAVPAAAVVSPALNGWTVADIIEPDGSQVFAAFGVTGPNTGIIAYVSSSAAYVRTTADGGVHWSARKQVSPAGRKILEVHMATYGRDVDVLMQVSRGLLVRHSANGGRTWGSTSTIPLVVGWPHIARGPAGLVAITGFDGSKIRWVAKVSSDGGETWGATTTLGSWELTGGDAPRSSIAVSGGTVVVMFTNQDQRLVTRRSTNGGGTWSPAKVIGSSGPLWLASFGVNGATIVAAYDEASGLDERLTVRRSTDRGATWSSPIPFGTHVTGGQVAFSQGSWHLVSSDDTVAWRYRSSNDGLTWSDPEVIDTGHSFQSPPIGVGAFTGGPAAAFVENETFRKYDIWFARK
jgi:hypothetical protein